MSYFVKNILKTIQTQAMILFPSSNEYASFYANYIHLMGQKMTKLKVTEEKNILHVLEKQGKKILDVFSALSEQESLYRYAAGKWSIKEMLGHLIDVEQIMAYRALAFYRGEKQELIGFNENEYVREAKFDKIPFSELLSRYQANRQNSVHLFKSFVERNTIRVGVANGSEMSVRALIYIIAGHELHHLNILEERYDPKHS